ncbi:hypothetical protein SAMN06265173_102109 [Thalassovita litoralis]|jgi:hypothetical protein|uniref:Cell division protein FtsL n=1 Tax=Thalassovita litoralis TaxID=1010611 RepID=A0A521B4G8_9RHOB|nr:cell division protein FtsL [Thalassovita litoralis]SMO41994.1 hypothetical protein SAMN06265173_102109 [Thalassovita litoralis]
MRSVFYVLTALGVIGLAFWAYRENYQTQAALDHASKLHRQIAESRARLGMLRAEWAYLNRPERLRELAALNYDRLGLMPFAPEQFGRVDQVAYPPQPGLPVLTEGVEVSSAAGARP